MAHVRSLVGGKALESRRVGRHRVRWCRMPALSRSGERCLVSRRSVRLTRRLRPDSLRPTRMYIELHTSSAFSFLDGASLPEALVERAAALGYPAIGLLRSRRRLRRTAPSHCREACRPERDHRRGADNRFRGSGLGARARKTIAGDKLSSLDSRVPSPRAESDFLRCRFSSNRVRGIAISAA